MPPHDRTSKSQKPKVLNARVQQRSRTPHRHHSRLSNESRVPNVIPVDAQEPQANTAVHCHTFHATTGTHTSQNASLATSYAIPQWLPALAAMWDNRERLRKDYNIRKRRCARAIDLVAQQAVVGVDIARFVPTRDHASERSLFEGSPLEDLSYSLREFVAVDPVQDPNVLYARAAIRDGSAVAGYIPALPQPRLTPRSDSEKADGSEAAEEREEVFGGW